LENYRATMQYHSWGQKQTGFFSALELCVFQRKAKEEGKGRPRPHIFNLGTSAKLCCIVFTAIKSLSVAL